MVAGGKYSLGDPDVPDGSSRKRPQRTLEHLADFGPCFREVLSKFGILLMPTFKGLEQDVISR